MKRSYFVIGLILLVLFIDQALKIHVKTTMEIGDEYGILGSDWARIHFVENEGMAFGLTLGGEYGKLALSLFRIIVVCFLGYYLFQIVREKLPYTFLSCVALILAGALGNIIDSTFYGMIFSASSPHHGGVATLFPPEGGYASFLHGKVVDMFYFPMFEGTFPSWFPVWGGEPFLFFRPVFNVADSAITVGILSIILFHRQFFNEPAKKEEATTATETLPIEQRPDEAV